MLFRNGYEIGFQQTVELSAIYGLLHLGVIESF